MLLLGRQSSTKLLLLLRPSARAWPSWCRAKHTNKWKQICEIAPGKPTSSSIESPWQTNIKKHGITINIFAQRELAKNVESVQHEIAERTQSALFHFFCKCTTHKSSSVWHALALYFRLGNGLSRALLLNPQLPNCTVAPFLTKPFPANARQSYDVKSLCRYRVS